MCRKHGIAEIDLRIHSAHAIWSGGALQLWVCCRTAREPPHRGELPRRHAARQRWLNRRQAAPSTARQGLRQDAAHSDKPSVSAARGERGVPKIVRLARSQTVSGDGQDGDG